MAKKVKELMLSLSDYAVVDEDATILDALQALAASQAAVRPGKQPHRAILVRDRRGEIIGKIDHFAFLRALLPERKPMIATGLLDRAGVGDDLRDESMRMLDLLTGDFIDVCERARNVAVRDVYSSTTVGIDEDAALSDAIFKVLSHRTLSLLVQRQGKTVGILRLSDLFEELSRQIMQGDREEEGN
jgi:CBS domain-containing protein